MDIHIPTASELQARIASSKVALVLWLLAALQGLIWLLGEFLDWKGRIEEAEMTIHQLSPFLGGLVSIFLSPIFSFALVSALFVYIIFVPPEARLKSKIVAWLAIVTTLAMEVLAVLGLAVIAVSMRLTGVTPFQVPLAGTGKGYLEPVAVVVPTNFGTLAPGTRAW
jgi:hypothetical protein